MGTFLAARVIFLTTLALSASAAPIRPPLPRHATLSTALGPVIERCEEFLTRGFDLSRGALFTFRHIRHGMNVRRGSNLKAPPSISTLELARLMKILVIDGNQLAFTEEASRLALKYGGAAYIPLASGFGNAGTVVVVDPELVKQVFNNSDDALIRGKAFDILRQLIGHGTLSTDHEEHTRRRNAIMPFFFNRTRVSTMTPQMNISIAHFLKRLDEAAEREDAVNLHELMKETTLGVITKVLYSYDISDEDARTVSQSLATALDFSTRYSIPVTLFKDPRRPIEDPTFKLAVRDMEAVAHRIIHWRLAHPLPGDRSTEDLKTMDSSQCDVLTYIFRDVGVTPGSTPNDQQMRVLRDEVMTLMLAGHETTANAITWTWVNLLETPSVLERMRAEVDSVLGRRTATMADFRNLPYTANVHRESLRHDSPLYWFARHAERDTALGPYFIPVNTHVFYSTLAVHRHPGHWPDGDRFDPDRFGEQQGARYGGAECPFAGGKNFCVGQPIATTELNLISIQIAQKYELFKADPTPVVREGKVTLQPRDGFWVRVRKRNSP